MGSRLSVKFLSAFGVLALAASGCMIGEEPEEAEDLSIHVEEGIIGACTVTLTVSPAGPVNAGDAVTATATATCNGGPAEIRFWRRGPSGTWVAAQAYGPGTVFEWDTTATTTGTYRFQAWARNVGSVATSECQSPVRDIVVENGTSQCFGTTISGNPASPISAGATVNFTATSTCVGGGSAEYKYYVRSAGGVWSIAQNYSPTATFAWNTTGLVNGSYIVQVWSRAIGNLNTYDKVASTTYTVTTPVCNVITLFTPTPVSPKPVGTQVTTSASATCTAGSPEYQFWIRRPNNTWFNLGAYSATANALWDTTPLAAGTYAVQAWTRRIGNVSQYDKASTLKNYVLTP